MKQSVKRMISSVAALLLLVGAFVVFVNFVQPAYADVANTQARVQAQEAFLKAQDAIIKKVEDITGTYEQGASAREAMAQALPNNPEVATALFQIGGIAQMYDITARSFAVTIPPPAPQVSSFGKASASSSGNEAPRKLVAEKPVVAVTIRAELLGTYANFKSFLANLETNIRIFDVKNITLQPIGKPSEDFYSLSVTVAAYYQQ
jgi:Tfp pilus assembly protein PilO